MADDAKFPSQLAERFQLRLPDGMRDRIAAEAKANNRSMNSEIIARLQASIDGNHDKITEDERNKIVISTTIQIMSGIKSAISEIPSEERGDIDEILDMAYDIMVKRITSSTIK